MSRRIPTLWRMERLCPYQKPVSVPNNDIKANYPRWATLFLLFFFRETTLACLGAPLQGASALGTGKVVGNERLINLRSSLEGVAAQSFPHGWGIMYSMPIIRIATIGENRTCGTFTARSFKCSVNVRVSSIYSALQNPTNPNANACVWMC
jgi:hypothetical protein